jgi:ABC-2 type transport system permease protein
MNARRTCAMARKELLHIVRDPISLIMAIAVPIVMLLLFGWALSLDVDRVPACVYDGDRTPESRDLIARFQGSRYFAVRFADHPAAVQETIDRGECLLGVSVLPGFARDLELGKAAQVQVALDGSDSNTASIALGYVEMMMRAYGQQLQGRAQNIRLGARILPPVEARLRVWYNSELKSKNFIVPGLIAVILMIISALLTSLTIAREWESGTMEQLLSTPLRPAEILLGKLAAFFAVGLVDTLIAVVTGVFIFSVPLRGSPLLLFSTACLFLFGGLCWGILLSAWARSQLLAYQLGMLTSFLPAFLLSGFVYAIENMPIPIQAISYIVPARYFVTILKGIYLKGVGVRVLFVQIAFLLIYAVVIFLLATKKMRQKVA